MLRKLDPAAAFVASDARRSPLSRRGRPHPCSCAFGASVCLHALRPLFPPHQPSCLSAAWSHLSLPPLQVPTSSCVKALLVAQPPHRNGIFAAGFLCSLAAASSGRVCFAGLCLRFRLPSTLLGRKAVGCVVFLRCDVWQLEPFLRQGITLQFLSTGVAGVSSSGPKPSASFALPCCGLCFHQKQRLPEVRDGVDHYRREVATL